MVEAQGGTFHEKVGIHMREPRQALALCGGRHLTDDGLGHVRLLNASALNHSLKAARASCTGAPAKDQLSDPTAVRAADAITTFVMDLLHHHSFWLSTFCRSQG